LVKMHKMCIIFRHKIKHTLFFSQITMILLESTINFLIVFQMQIHSDKYKEITSSHEVNIL